VNATESHRWKVLGFCEDNLRESVCVYAARYPNEFQITGHLQGLKEVYGRQGNFVLEPLTVWVVLKFVMLVLKRTF